MKQVYWRFSWLLILVSLLALTACGGGGSSTTSSQQAQITVATTGSGSVSSSPAGINCPGACTASFQTGTTLALSATPAAGFQFSGFGGACSGKTCKVVLSGNQSVSASFTPAPGQVSVNVSGNGTVTSTPAGINCPTACTANFANGTAITLTETPGSGASFSGFSGACTGTSCQLTAKGGQDLAVSASFTGTPQNLAAINHIIVLLQENRSFDEYFGHLADYWTANNFPQASNGTTFNGEPANASNVDQNGDTVTAFQMGSACTENPSPFWNEAHVDRNAGNATSATAAPMDGFVREAGKDAAGFGFYDVLGHRAMGYYDGTELNYYYFMASSFATSDSWFSPVMTRTQPNRMYLYAATSNGHVRPLQDSKSGPLSNQTIFQLLDSHGISWKIYVRPDSSGCTTPSCLFGMSYLNQFTYGQYVLKNAPSRFAPVSQLTTDMQNGTLPQVAFIEPASNTALDEHSSDDDVTNPPNVQSGANYVAGLINTLMGSQSWKDSVFILSFDEFGGFYDHVPPQPAVPPDAFSFPTDLQQTTTETDICHGNTTDLICGFYYTGYRVPLIVISPFTKKNYVSHTLADYTAILKLIETRFGLPSLTARDNAQPDMTEFFDFVNAPWKTPPSPPAQVRTLPCVLETLGPHTSAGLTVPAISVSPNPAPAGGQAMVTLNLANNAIQTTTVNLSSVPAVPSMPATASIAINTYSTSFTITVPTGITSLTITGTIGGIPVSATVPVQ